MRAGVIVWVCATCVGCGSVSSGPALDAGRSDGASDASTRDAPSGLDSGRDAENDQTSPHADGARADGASSDGGLGEAAVGEGGDAASAHCMDGAPVTYLQTSCPGTPGTVPGALSSQVGFNTRGETLTLDGLDETDLPCIPARVCVASAAPTMLFSDEPESPTTDGVLYADVIGPGNYRAYVYHTNAGAGLRKFPVVLLNQGSVAVNVTITAEGIAGPSQDYIGTGKAAIQSWFASQGMASTFAVPPGERVLLDQDLDAVHAGMNELAHAIIDFTLDGAVKASVVSVVDTEDATVVTAGLSLLSNTGMHVRGTFPGAALEIEATSPVDTTGARRWRLGFEGVDKTLTGHDYVDGTSVSLSGNYGVSYTFALTVTGTTGFLLSPQGGAWGGAANEPAGIDGPNGVTLLPSATDSLDDQQSAIVLGLFPAGAVTGLALLSAGGSSLPVDLLTVPIAP